MSNLPTPEERLGLHTGSLEGLSCEQLHTLADEAEAIAEREQLAGLADDDNTRLSDALIAQGRAVEILRYAQAIGCP